MRKTFFVAIMLTVLCVFFNACTMSEDEMISTEKVGLGGEKFYFLGSFIVTDPRDADESKRSADSGAGYTDTIEDEVIYNQCLSVEKEMNCVIVRDGFDYNSNSYFAAAYAAGDVKADILVSPFNTLKDLYRAGVLCDLYELKSLDATDEEKWGTERRKEATSYHGALYAFPCEGSLYMPRTLTFNGALVCNEHLFDSFNTGTTLDEMIENGSWTFDGFYSLFGNISDIGAERPIYAFTHINSVITISVYANGGDSIVKNKNGKYICGYALDNSINSLEWAKKVLQSPYIHAEDGSFESGYSVFCLEPAASALYSQIEDIRWLPFPYGPDVEYGSTYSGYFGYHDNGTAILDHTENPERNETVASIADKLFAPTEYFGKTGYDDYIRRSYFYSETDYKVYKEHCINANYDWSKEILAYEDMGRATSSLLESAMSSNGSVKPYIEQVKNYYITTVLKELNGD